MYIANWISLILVMIGAQNWLYIGLFNFNLVSWISMGNTIIERVIYVIVGLASILLGISLFVYKGNLPLNANDNKETML